MAKTNTTAAPSATETVNATSIANMPARFTDLGLDRFMYKPESCQGMPLVGMLIGFEEFGRDSKDKDDWWDALVFRTTQPTKVVSKNDKAEEIVIDCEVGEEVMVPVSEKLKKLVGYAKHEKLMAEFFIQPLKKEVLEINPKTGEVIKSMWRFKVGGAQPVPRVLTTSWDNIPSAFTEGGESSNGTASLPA